METINVIFPNVGVVVLLFGYLLESVPVGHFFDDFPYWKVFLTFVLLSYRRLSPK